MSKNNKSQNALVQTNFQTLSPAELLAVAGGGEARSTAPRKTEEERARDRLDKTNPGRRDQSSARCTVANSLGAGLGAGLTGIPVIGPMLGGIVTSKLAKCSDNAL